jgi:S-adenosylmethionine:tRNA-ribosyltransferase-isomerase (queuine synthetase)
MRYLKLNNTAAIPSRLIAIKTTQPDNITFVANNSDAEKAATTTKKTRARGAIKCAWLNCTKQQIK